MKRILKENGSIYLHCDHHAAQYLKLMMDSIFGKNNFRNEIVWCYTGPGSPQMRQFNRKHDNIFWYTKSETWCFNADAVRISHHDKTKENFKSGLKGLGFVADTYDISEEGKVPETWWPQKKGNGLAIAARQKNQYVGYPTQKPLALLQRIIRASSNYDDFVMDPFCGCATACVAAEIEGRQWIGIDVGPKAYDLVKSRLAREVKVGDGEMFGDVIHRTDIPGDDKGEKSKNIKHIRYGEQEGRCTGCREHFPYKNMTIDHIVPRAKGGTDTDDNIQLLCNWCNSKKGSARTQDELVAILAEQGIRK